MSTSKEKNMGSSKFPLLFSAAAGMMIANHHPERMCFPMVNEKMAQDLRNLGIQSNDVILMHSSLSSLGYVEGGADTVIDTLMSVLSEGTLLIPALSWELSRMDNPVFSVKDTPSCVGTISETFRKRPGVIRSMHPTHSVCGMGVLAEEILSQHIHTDTPAGPKSPFGLLPQYGGKVLMLGCGLRPNTSMHAVEELSRPWYLMREEKVTFTLVDSDGNAVKKDYECHNFKGVAQRYDRLENVMDIPSGKVLDATCHLIDAATMWRVGHQKYLEDENYFTEPRQM